MGGGAPHETVPICWVTVWACIHFCDDGWEKYHFFLPCCMSTRCWDVYTGRIYRDWGHIPTMQLGPSMVPITEYETHHWGFFEGSCGCNLIQFLTTYHCWKRLTWMDLAWRAELRPNSWLLSPLLNSASKFGVLYIITVIVSWFLLCSLDEHAVRTRMHNMQVIGGLYL